MAVNGFSSASASTFGDWDYEVRGGTAVITAYRGTAATLTIPSTLGGYAVTAIGWCAFEGNDVETVTVPNSVKTIGDGAFANCWWLKSVAFGDGVTAIGNSAFARCHSLAKITIPSNVKTVGAGAFAACPSLTAIQIADDVACIESGAFSDTAYENDDANWSGDVLYIDRHLIAADQAIDGAYTVRADTKAIAADAFSNCDALTAVTVPSGVKTIGDYAFNGCDALVRITLPDHALMIGEGAFHNTAYAQSVTHWTDGALYIGGHLVETDPAAVKGTFAVRSGTKSVAKSAFQYDTQLTAVTFPSSVQAIGKRALAGCTALTGVNVSGGNTAYESTGNCLIEKATHTLIAGCNASAIPTDGRVTAIAEGAFVHCPSLTNVAIPAVVTTIGKGAFYDCLALKQVTYGADKAAWQRIDIADNNTDLTDAAITYTSAITVSFHANGGSGAPYAQKKFPGTPLTLSTNIPTRVGYAFLGWGTSPSATAVAYHPGSQLKTNAITALYAVWQKDAYRITFAGNGGRGVPNAQIKIPGTPLKLATQRPTRAGYAFVGWGTSPSAATVAYHPGSQFKNNTHTTLYAVWKKDAYRITFAGNGGRSVPNAQIKIPGKPLTLATQTPTRSGYAFLGWGTSPSAATVAYHPGSQFKNNSHTTLYAVWQKDAYRITFSGNGGSGVPNAQIKIPGTPLTLAAQTPTRAGYTFLGWGTSASAATVAYHPGSLFKNNSHTTLYAVWKKGS